MDSPGFSPVVGTTSATKPVSTGPVGTALKTEVPSTDGKHAPKPVEGAPEESLKPLRDPRSLAFQVDGSRIITTIVDAQNNTVIQQIPDADVIRLAAAIDRLKGFFLLAKA